MHFSDFLRAFQTLFILNKTAPKSLFSSNNPHNRTGYIFPISHYPPIFRHALCKARQEKPYLSH